MVENPEAHLHPAGQSRLGRFLARVAGSGGQVVVETHSDHVINGIRLGWWRTVRFSRTGLLCISSARATAASQTRLDSTGAAVSAHGQPDSSIRSNKPWGNSHVPSVGRADAPRFVLDESSFDFRRLPDTHIERHLDDFNGSLLTLRSREGHEVSCPPMWDGVECLDGCELWHFLSRQRPSAVDRDTLLLTFSLLSRCPEWSADEVAETSVSVDGAQPAMALSVAYALTMAMVRHGVAVLVFPGAPRRGFRLVHNAGGKADIFFFHEPASLPEFWRHLFAFENVKEPDFFVLAESAFPDLVFHPDLSFGHFAGAYADLRDRVVTILAGLNDHFAREYARCHGLPRDIQAAMGRHQVDLSPESPNTRSSQRLMRQRRGSTAASRSPANGTQSSNRTATASTSLRPHRGSTARS